MLAVTWVLRTRCSLFAVRYTTLILTDWEFSSINQGISSSHPASNIAFLPRPLEAQISPSAPLSQLQLPTESGHRTSLSGLFEADQMMTRSVAHASPGWVVHQSRNVRWQMNKHLRRHEEVGESCQGFPISG